MARPRVPPIGALLGFEAAARHKSFSRAAREMNLTQGAVSRQVSRLEREIGVDLFIRNRQTVELTEAGRTYLGEVQQILAQLSSATHRVGAIANSRNRLNLAVQPTFATRWLIPRLSGFINQYPDIQINFAVRAQPFDFVAEQFDVAVNYGRLALPDLTCELLLEDRITPVCSPEFRDRHRIASVRDLARVRLLHQTTRLNAWPDWFKSVKLPDCDVDGGIKLERILMVVEAAVAGLGVALLPRFFIEEELARQQLVLLFERKTIVNGGYFIVYNKSQMKDQSRKFSQWLKTAARPYGRREALARASRAK
jgi:LysR family transcriptional regulator, glycine cleavage system transcriptional activator